MAASTQTFQESSALVREAITGLDQKAGKPNLAEMLRNLQKEEQYKLRFTLILQVSFCRHSEMPLTPTYQAHIMVVAH